MGAGERLLVRIQWRMADDYGMKGVTGIDAEYVAVDDLVTWTKKRRRELRRSRARHIARRLRPKHRAQP